MHRQHGPDNPQACHSLRVLHRNEVRGDGVRVLVDAPGRGCEGRRTDEPDGCEAPHEGIGDRAGSGAGIKIHVLRRDAEERGEQIPRSTRRGPGDGQFVRVHASSRIPRRQLIAIALRQGGQPSVHVPAEDGAQGIPRLGSQDLGRLGTSGNGAGEVEHEAVDEARCCSRTFDDHLFSARASRPTSPTRPRAHELQVHSIGVEVGTGDDIPCRVLAIPIRRNPCRSFAGDRLLPDHGANRSVGGVVTHGVLGCQLEGVVR